MKSHEIHPIDWWNSHLVGEKKSSEAIQTLGKPYGDPPVTLVTTKSPESLARNVQT